MIRTVRQLAALLAAGRSGPPLWHELAMASLAAEEPHLPPAPSARTRDGTAPPGGEAAPGSRTEVLLATERASVLGLSAAASIRAACVTRYAGTGRTRTNQGMTGPADIGSRATPPVRSARRGGPTPAELAVWWELAACLEVSEASGAPVASVLSRLATGLESELDAAALRRTALAGPRATSRLLNWLPLLGLLLGMVLGADPVAVLLGTTVGWWCLGGGAVLLVLGRWWSKRLLTSAEGPAPYRPAVPRTRR